MSEASVVSALSKSSLPGGPYIPKFGGRVNLTAYSGNDGTNTAVVSSGVIGDYGFAWLAAGREPKGLSGQVIQ
jgi:hypothetical protein